MRTFILLFVLLLAVSWSPGHSPAGKTYVVKTGESCKMMQGGGCSVSYYACMQFDHDSVSVWNCMVPKCSLSSYEERYKTPVTKKRCKYTFGGERVTIYGDSPGVFVLSGTTLTGSFEKDKIQMTFTEGTVPVN